MNAAHPRPPKYPEPTRCTHCGHLAASIVCNICGRSKVAWPDMNTTYARLKQSDDGRNAR